MNKFKEAVLAAQDSFWATIADKYPSIKAWGAAPPQAQAAFAEATEQAVKTMIEHNLKTFTVTSSNGQIIADKETGECLIHECEIDIENITKFDIEEYKKYHGFDEVQNDIDILDLGYWYKAKGTIEYEEPAHDWRKEIIELRNETL